MSICAVLSEREKENFFLEHDGLLVALAMKYKNSGIEFDDLLQYLREAACKAMNKYDPSKGTKLTTFVHTCAENAILEILRENKAQKRDAVVVSLDLGVDDEGSERDSLLNMDLAGVDFLHSAVADLDSQIQTKEFFNAVSAILKELPYDQQIALQMHIQGYSQVVIGKYLHTSQSKVSKTLKIAICELRIRLQDMGLI